MGTKIVKLDNVQTGGKEGTFAVGITIGQMRKIWNDENITYTDEQLIRIMEWLYAMAEIVIGTLNENPHLLIDLNIRHPEEGGGNVLQTGEEHKPAA